MNKLNLINVYVFLAGLAAMQLLMMFTRYMTATNEVPNPFSREYQEAVAEQANWHPVYSADAPLQIGMLMPNGTIFAGISPDTRQPYYTTKADVNEFLPFTKAREFCMKLSSYDNGNWRLPTTQEMDNLYARRQEIGGFNTNAEGAASWHWSSGSRLFTAGMKKFTDGAWYNVGKTVSANIRCVRDDIPQQLQADAEQAAEQAAMQAAQIEPAAGGPDVSNLSTIEPEAASEAYQRAITGGRD